MNEMQLLIKGLNLSITAVEKEKLIERLAGLINELILNDFQKLVQLLYLVDVQESKLKRVLKENSDADAAYIISSLIIERQLEKIKARGSFRPPNDINDED